MSLRLEPLLAVFALTLASFALPASAQPTPTTPRCCGQSCGAGSPCCPGTVCSTNGNCVPATCVECGDRGCDVDNTTCTATCGPIRCCLAACTSDRECCTGTTCRSTSAGRQCVPQGCSECTAQGRTCQVAAGCEPVCGAPECCRQRCTRDYDCCSGTSCQPAASGERLCLPTACDDCAGMTPHCQIDEGCNAVCVAPANCGLECSTLTECGPGALCHEFSGGTSRCVPSAFESICRACGTGGCRFEHSSCAIVCGPPQ